MRSAVCFGAGRMERAVAAVLLAVLSMQLVACSGDAAAWAVKPSKGAVLSLGSAVTDFVLEEPVGAVVLLELIVQNRGNDVTQSTSIRWEPAFGAAYTFLASDPPAWRVHVDEVDGWGVVDTSGVLAEEDGLFRIWFGPAGEPSAELLEEGPRISVVADGNRLVGEQLATPVHAHERARLRAHQVFERGGLAVLADTAAFVPNSSRGAFVAGAGLAVMLSAITVAGIAALLRRP